MANTVWRCSYNSTHSSGVQYVNTFHVVVRDDPVSLLSPTADAVRDALHSALTTKYRNCLPSDVTVNKLVVREELTPGSTAVPAESSQTIGLAGTLALSGDRLPIPLCALITLYTNAAVRSGHGRMFLPNPGQAANLQTTSLWDTGTTWYGTNVPAFTAELKAHHSVSVVGNPDSTAALVVYSRTRRARADADWYFDVTSIVQRTAPHWLRSRMTAP